MRFILRKDIPTLVKGETGICLDSFSIITHTQFEGLREHSLKDLAGVPVTLLEEIRNFLNEAYADIKGFFIVKFIIDSVETPVATPNKTKVVAISIPARTGYTSAWQLNGSNFNFDTLITSDISLLPAYTVIKYDITYNLNGGTDGDTPTTYTIETPTITLGTPTKTGYIFDGWFNNVELTGEPVTEIVLGSTGDIELWAGWTAITYSISYILDDGTNDEANPETYTIETPTITLADPTKAGHVFAGWTEGNSIPLGSTGNKTFTATWTVE